PELVSDDGKERDVGEPEEQKQRKPPKRLNYFTDWHKDLGLRDTEQMRRDAERFRLAGTYKERETITQQTGTRDSCLLRDLSYWRPPMQVATEGFHTLYPNTCGVSSAGFGFVCLFGCFERSLLVA